MVLPLLDPALGGAALLTFMTSLASFSAPYIFGGGFRVMTTQIVATRLNGDDRLAMVETVSLTLLALLALLAAPGNARRSTSGRRTQGGRPRAGSGPAAGRAAGCCGGWLGPRGAVLLLPHLTLLLVSFVPVGTWTTEPLPPAYTLRNYLDAAPGPGARPAAGQQPLAGDRRHGGRRGDRAGAARSCRPAPGARRAG